MKPVGLAIAFLVSFASILHAQEDVDKVHVRVARKVAPATVAIEGGGVRGSGVIIDKSGLILTSPTAAGTSSNRVTVLTKGSRSYTGKVLGRSNDRELVLVKIDAGQDLPFVELGDSDAAKQGQIAYVFGDSYDSIRADDQAAMSLGVISGIYELTQRHDKSLYTGKVLETSAAVNPSQNGGPLVDREGRLLGLVTLNYDDSKFIGLAVPSFMLALVLMYVGFKYFNASIGGLFSDEFIEAPWSLAKVWDMTKHLPLPALILGLAGTAQLIRIMRANLLDELRKPYVVTARSKGLTELRVILKYPVRLALNPFASTIGYTLPYIVSGSIIVSLVLGLPTVGPLLLKALIAQDMFLAGTIVLLLGVMTVIGTLISDILLVWIDPRIRLEET